MLSVTASNDTAFDPSQRAAFDLHVDQRVSFDPVIGFRSSPVEVFHLTLVRAFHSTSDKAFYLTPVRQFHLTRASVSLDPGLLDSRTRRRHRFILPRNMVFTRIRARFSKTGLRFLWEKISEKDLKKTYICSDPYRRLEWPGRRGRRLDAGGRRSCMCLRRLRRRVGHRRPDEAPEGTSSRT